MTSEIETLRDALDHIMKTAKLSRTQSKRDRWIAYRAYCALHGRDDWKEDELPPAAKLAEWLPLDEWVPVVNQRVIYFVPEYGSYSGYYLGFDDNTGAHVFSSELGERTSGVTDWMPWPNNPKGRSAGIASPTES